MKLTEKLLAVMRACAHIGKDAVNDEVGYPYVSAAKINDAVNRALTENGIATTAESTLVDIRTIGDKVLATVEVAITLYDGDGETLTIRGIGSGIDDGDKSVLKAQTAAVKYAWKNSLLIADSSDDPDTVKRKTKYSSTYKTTIEPKTEKSVSSLWDIDIENFVAPF